MSERYDSHMNNHLEILSSALQYIEEHLEDKIQTEDIALACFCSKSSLEKTFRYVNDMSVHEYINRRRMTRAAKILVEQPDISILTIALQYGYGTNESFTRAFKQVWNCSPSVFRNSKHFLELFPRLNPPMENGDAYMRKRKPVDITTLYELFVTRKDCYFICCDIQNMIAINQISRKAGDLAILEAMQRMEESSDVDDIVFRIGGDEFALLTNHTEITYAEKIADLIRQKNTSPFIFEGTQIPLSLHVGITKAGRTSPLKYSELFTELHTTIKDSKETC